MQLKYWYLENTTTRNAFYEVICVLGSETLNGNPIVALTYGKRGTNGQTKFHTELTTDDKAVAFAISLASAKQAKQYEPVHNELLIDLPEDSRFGQRIHDFLRFHQADGVRRSIAQKIAEGDVVSRENALSYIEGFTTECELFLRMARDESFTEEEIRRHHEVLTKKWNDFKDKYDRAEAAMSLVQMRSMTVVSR